MSAGSRPAARGGGQRPGAGGGQPIPAPGPEVPLLAGDTVVVVGTANGVKRAAKLLNGEPIELPDGHPLNATNR